MPAAIPRSQLAVEGSGQGSAGPPAPDPGVLETIGAGFRTTKDDIGIVHRRRLSEAYTPIVQALQERGEGGTWWFTNPAAVLLPFQNTLDHDRIWGAVERVRATDPTAFADLPATREEFEEGVTTRQGARARDLETVAAGNGVAAFVGALGAMPFDPVNVATAPIGTGAKTIWQAVLRGAILNSGIEATQQVPLAQARQRMGETLTVGEAALNVGAAGVFGGVLEGAPRVFREVVSRHWDRLPAPLRQRWEARTLAKADPLNDPVLMADLAEAIVGRDNLSELEASSIAVARREGEIAAANPFRRDGAGTAMHEALAAEMLGQVLRDVPLPGPARALPQSLAVDGPRARAAPARSSAGGSGTGGRLHGGIVAHLENAGIGRALARGIAAGIEAESRSNPNIVNPDSGAYGIGQWLGPRKRELFRRYGKNPTMAEQLDFLVWELRGGDHAGKKVLAQADEAAALRSYIVDFMRPAAGRETTGDLERGMAALGRDPRELPVESSGPTLRDDFAEDEAEMARIQQALDSAAERALGLAETERTARDGGEGALADAIDDDPAFAELPDPLLSGLRAIVEAPGQSLNRLPELAQTLGFAEADVRQGLERLAGLGEITVNGATGKFMRKPRGGAGGPDDLVRFVARHGGLAYDGLNDAGRKGGSRGHDLRNSGNLARFVPGVGPLLRPAGRGLDDMAELAWEAGYFGPPETTPRPTDAELIDTLDQVLRTGEKRYADQAPVNRADDVDAQRQEWGEAEQDAYWARYDRLSDAALNRYKTVMLMRDVEELEALMRAGTELLPPREPGPDLTDDELAPWIDEWLDRKFAEALDDALLEAEDDFYGEFASLDPTREAGAPEGGGPGRAAEPGDAGEGAARGGTGEDAGPPPLDHLTPEQRAPFLDPDSAAVRAQADSLMHDARAAVEREAVDPNEAALQRQRAQLGAEAPMRARADQDSTLGFGLFGAADGVRLDAEGEARPIRDLLDDIDAEEAELKAIRDCL